MAFLPDQFDLWVRKAKQMAPARQLDCLLGMLFAQPEWFFFNQDEKKVLPAQIEIENAKCLILFSDSRKMLEFFENAMHQKLDQLPSLAIPAASGTEFCLQFRASGCEAILVNPGTEPFQVSLEALERFNLEWQAYHRSQASRGFWIPNMTTEEDDFWQEHGL